MCFYSLPDGPLADLRRARVERAACKARFRNTLLPPGERGLPRPGHPTRAPLSPGLAGECADLTARLAAVQARIAQLETALGPVAEALPAYALLQTLPGVGPTVAAILLAEIGDIAWDHQVQPAPEARGARHRAGGVGPVRGDRADLEVRAPTPALDPGPRQRWGPPGVPPGGLAGTG